MTDTVITFTQDLIKEPSITPKAEKALDQVEDFLKALGFTCERLPFGEGDARIDNLLAYYGESGPHFCYAGHVDVVPYGPVDEWTFDPLSGAIEGDKLYGRGAADMKGSVAAFCFAAKGFIANNPKMKGKISLLITCDEEALAINGTKPVIEWMAKNGHNPDFCLVGEPTCRKEFGDTVKIGRRGSLNGHLKVIGKQGHIAYPHRFDNPVPALSKAIAALSDYKFDQGNDHFEPSNLEVVTLNTSSHATNVVPGSAECKFNIRYNTEQNKNDLKETITKLIGDHCDLPFEIDFHHSGDAFLSKITDDLLKAFSDVIEKHTAHRPEPTTNGGTSDARFIQHYCPTLEFGPIGKTIHQIDEHISILDLEKLVKIYEDMIKTFFN